MLGRRTVIAIALNCAAATASASPLTIAYDEDSTWAPYVYPADAPQPGALREAVRLVFDMAGLPLEERFTSRRRAAAAAERSVDAIGYAALSWVSGRADGRLLSATLMRADERLIFAEGVAFPFRNCADLRDQAVWGVPVIVYPCGDIAPERRMSSERGLTFRVARGDIPSAILDYDVARYWGRRLGYGLNIGPVVRTADIRLTLDASRRDDLRRLNVAIFQAVRYGRIAEIKRRYLMKVRLVSEE